MNTTDHHITATDHGIIATDYNISRTDHVIDTTDRGISSNPGYDNERRQHFIYRGHAIDRGEETSCHETSYLKQKKEIYFCLFSEELRNYIFHG